VLEALRAGNSARALRLINEAERQYGPRGEFSVLRAEVYAAQRNPESEVAALREALRRDASLYEPRLRLAASLEARGLWQDAVHHYREAIALHPQRPVAYLRLASLYERQQQAVSALQVLREGLDTIPEDLLLLEALAQHYQRRDMLAQAEEVWLAVIEQATGKQLAEAYQSLGDLHLDREDLTAAYAAYSQADTVAPNSSSGEMSILLREADHLVNEALAEARSALAPAPGASREERYASAADAVETLQHTANLAAAFADDFPDPVTYAQRTVYYSLALEAATNAMVYVDTGETDLFYRAQDRLEEARQAGTELANQEKTNIITMPYR
jgi:tetratricopeptide (TPR) repeat protein